VTPLPPDPGISAAAKTALDMAPFNAEIAQKISDEVNKLVKNPSDPGTVAMVRQWLITEDPPTGMQPYQEAYSQALNRTFMNVLAQPDAPVNAKINIALVIKDLAAPKMNLVPTAEKLLADKCPAVVYVGEEAACAILPGALQNPNFNPAMRDALLKAIVAGVENNPDGQLAGFIADRAYRAINPMQWTAGAMPQGGNLSALFDCNMKLQGSRIKMYKAGVPRYPMADTFASYLLLSRNSWNAMNNNQQVNAVQLAVNLVSVMGQRLAAPGLVGSQAQDLVDAFKEQGAWISGLGGIIGDPQLAPIGDQISHLNVGMPPAAIKSACDALFQELSQNIPAFSTLVPPPNILSTSNSAPATEASQ
jgi:hypothetical protein